MRENRAKRILKAGGLAIGAGVDMSDPALVEIIGLAPWAEGDWYVSKATHTWQDVSTPEVRRSTKL